MVCLPTALVPHPGARCSQVEVGCNQGRTSSSNKKIHTSVVPGSSSLQADKIVCVCGFPSLCFTPCLNQSMLRQVESVGRRGQRGSQTSTTPHFRVVSRAVLHVYPLHVCSLPRPGIWTLQLPAAHRQRPAAPRRKKPAAVQRPPKASSKRALSRRKKPAAAPKRRHPNRKH